MYDDVFLWYVSILIAYITRILYNIFWSTYFLWLMFLLKQKRPAVRWNLQNNKIIVL